MLERQTGAEREAESLPRPSVGLSVVVPCFNEVENVSSLHQELTRVCAPLGSYELVLVNDGSRDGTWAAIQALARSDPHVVGIDLSRNFGHQFALSAGLSLCRGERILMIDADLQDPPDLLPQMMRLMDDGADVVYGTRISRPGETAFKKLSARGFYRLLARLADVDIPPDTGDFHLMRRRVLEVLLKMPEQHRFLRGMVAWAGFKQAAVPYERRPRKAGRTNYNLVRMVRFAVDAITGFSIAPLRLSLALSGFFFVVSAMVFLYAAYAYLFLRVVPGWTSIMLLVSVVSAIQLFCLGIIGEYVGRIFMEAKGRPLFVIREVCTQNSINAD